MSDTWDGQPPEEWREKDGQHWIGNADNPSVYYIDTWLAKEKRWVSGTPEMMAIYFCYLGPCPTPDEVAALRERAERAEAMLELTQQNMIAAQEHAMKAEKEVWAAMCGARAEALREAQGWFAEILELQCYMRSGGAMVDDLGDYERGMDQAMEIAGRAHDAITARMEKEKPDDNT